MSFVPMTILIKSYQIRIIHVIVSIDLSMLSILFHTIHLKITVGCQGRRQSQMLRWKSPNEELDPKDAMIAGISWHPAWFQQFNIFEGIFMDILYGYIWLHMATIYGSASSCIFRVKPSVSMSFHDSFCVFFLSENSNQSIPSLRGFASNMQQMIEHEGESSYEHEENQLTSVIIAVLSVNTRPEELADGKDQYHRKPLDSCKEL